MNGLRMLGMYKAPHDVKTTLLHCRFNVFDVFSTSIQRCPDVMYALYHFLTFFFSPNNGTILTNFRLRCSGWLNPDQPTTYEFRYDTGAKATVGISSTIGDDYPILNPISLLIPSLLDQKFPTGLKEQDYGIQLRIRIVNKYGQFTELNGPDLKIKVSKLIIFCSS